MNLAWLTEVFTSYPLTLPPVFVDGFPQLDNIFERTLNVYPDIRQFLEYFDPFWG